MKTGINAVAESAVEWNFNIQLEKYSFTGTTQMMRMMDSGWLTEDTHLYPED